MSSFQTHTLHLIGSKRVRKGTDYYIDYTFNDPDTGAPINMSAYQPAAGGNAFASFKNEDRSVTEFSTAASSVVITWPDISTIRIAIPAAKSTLIVGTIPNTADYQIEALEGPTGRTDRILQGRFELDEELNTT